MFCIQCGKKLSAGAKFCSVCGAAVLSEEKSDSDGNGLPPLPIEQTLSPVFSASPGTAVPAPAPPRVIPSYYVNCPYCGTTDCVIFEDESQTTCDRCGKGFSVSAGMERRRRVDIIAHLARCPYCGADRCMVFERQDRAQCHQCSRIFLLSESPEVIEPTHREFTCPACETRIWTSAWAWGGPIKCPECNRQFMPGDPPRPGLFRRFFRKS